MAILYKTRVSHAENKTIVEVRMVEVRSDERYVVKSKKSSRKAKDN